MMLLLRKLREDKDWSRNEVARRARIDASDYSKIERAILRPSASQIRKIARALSVPVENAETLLVVVERAAETTADEHGA